MQKVVEFLQKNPVQYLATQELLMGFPDSEQLLKLLANRAFR